MVESEPPGLHLAVEPGMRESLELAEAARETKWQHPSFVLELFQGRVRHDLIFPYPEQSAADKRIGDEYVAKIEQFLKAHIDPDAVDRAGDLPAEAVRGLIDLGCFGMKIPKEYGGLGFSQTNYNRTLALVGSHCGSTAVWISAHQSIGVPQPLKLFGTENQKKRYLPRLAHGAISAFALTELDVGSDPAQMSTTATPTEDGQAYLLNGQKLWCTNGPVAELIVVMARTPSRMIGGKERKQITAFIVETAWPGVEVVHRCRFMGLRGIQNGLLRLTNVKVPKENILWAEGRGLKLALMTLNTGRTTMPAICAGLAKYCLGVARRWANQRSQWGGPIGHHEAIAAKLTWMASHTFAMEAITWLVSALIDRGGVDIRLEAAMAKLFCSEASWAMTNETFQIRGGRGYETADSLKARGEEPVPVERLIRDARINTIIEGTSEILRLFIAREALDPHATLAADLLNPQAPLDRKLKTLGGMAAHYTLWYPSLWIPQGGARPSLPHPLNGHLGFVERTSRRLARALFHAMAVHQQRLEKRQLLLMRLVNIGTDLFAMAATLSRAQMLARSPETANAVELADYFCRLARRRIEGEFHGIRTNDDRATGGLARAFLDHQFPWLESGIINSR